MLQRISLLMENRKLIIYLAKNDFKTKYAGSYLGIVWAFIQPIVTICLYWFVFQVGLRSSAVSDVPFVLWLMAGLIPWFFFSESLVNATNCFIEYSYLVKKVVFNISVLPFIKVISSLFVHVFFILLMFTFYAFSGYYPGIIMIQIVYYTACMIALVLSMAYFTSAISIFFKDTLQIINIIMQIGVWMTPIMWNINIMPAKFIRIFKINPMYYVVDGYRNTMINNKWFISDWKMTLYFWCVVIILYFVSKYVYKRLKPHFSDSL